MKPIGDLYALAETLGVQTGYWDTRGEHHTASVEALVAVLGAMGVEVSGPDDLDHLRDRVRGRSARLSPPVVVAQQGEPICFMVPVQDDEWTGDVDHLRVEIISEGGDVSGWDVELSGTSSRREVEVEVDANIESGYHRLIVETRHRRDESLLLVTPGKVFTPPGDERAWGVFAPLYGLWSNTGPGPTTAGLARLADHVHELGGSVIATLPLLASYLTEPFDPSPYTPVSRMFWNELFVDLDRVTMTSGGPETFDYAERARVVDMAIDDAAAVFFRDGIINCGVVRDGSSASGDMTRSNFDSFLARRPEVVDYARFRATVDRQGTGWHAWPTRQRHGYLRTGDYDQSRVRHHLFAQWLMDAQMSDLSDRLAERGQRLYLDLPVGSHGDGYDTWRFGERFVSGVGAGAPPDDFFSGGQNWGFPPLSPDAGRDDAYSYLRGCLRHHMAVSGIVRLDHVMQFERLWWVPDGMAAHDGVYVRYPREELFAVVAIESHRHNCVVVGENLGTVSDEVSAAMERHGMPGMYVAQFEMPKWAGAELADPPSGCVAAFDTHDTATFAGFLAGGGERVQQVENMRGFLSARGFMDPDGDDHALLLALLAFMGESDAWTVLVTLEDLWSEMNPQNVPGTPFSRPNWVQRLALSLDDLDHDPSVADALVGVDSSRECARDRVVGVVP